MGASTWSPPWPPVAKVPEGLSLPLSSRANTWMVLPSSSLPWTKTAWSAPAVLPEYWLAEASDTATVAAPAMARAPPPTTMRRVLDFTR